MALLPAERLGIAVLVNAYPSGLPEALRASFFDLVLKGKVEKDHVGEWTKNFEGLASLYREYVLGLKTDYTRPPARPLLRRARRHRTWLWASPVRPSCRYSSG